MKHASFLRHAASLAPVLLLVATAAATEPAPAREDAVHAFRVGKIVTMDPQDRVINNAVLIVRDGKITELGKAADINIPENAAVVDMPHCWLVPGLVDCHNHTAGDLGDLNDGVYLTNPGLRTLDTIVPESRAVKKARSGGVTTALLIPGSGNNMSGFGTVVKFAGHSVDDMVVRYPGSLKIAQAGNPEGYWYGVGRMFMNYNTRQTLEKARAYHEQWEAFEKNTPGARQPQYDPIFDDFRGLFRREFPASVHTQIYQVVMTTVDMLAVKLGIFTMMDHSEFDGWKVAPLVLEAGEGKNIMTIQGPRAFHYDRTQRKMHGNAQRWWQGGVRMLGLNTDAPVVPQEELFYQGSMACWFGWTPYEALAGVTRIPAMSLKLEHRLGSIEQGKDADFGIWSGDPIDPRSVCWITVINGNIAHDGREDRRF